MAVFIAVALQAIVFQAPARAANPVTGRCPLAAHLYQAQPVQTQVTGAVGEEIILAFTLDPPEPPQGFFLSVNMTVVQEPEPAKVNKPQILTGFPETSAVFSIPGTYRYEVVVALVAKSSCGGVKADTVFNGEVQIEVYP